MTSRRRLLWSLPLAMLVCFVVFVAISEKRKDRARQERIVQGVPRAEGEPEWSWRLRIAMAEDLDHVHPARQPDPTGMVRIPAGEARLGGNCGALLADSAPYRAERVAQVPAFTIDRNLVTFAQFAQCVAAQGCPQLVKKTQEAMPDAPDRPALTTYQEATVYCQWLGKRLPTEDEWEKAARGTDGRSFPWGNDGADADRRANFCDRRCTFDWADAGADDGFELISPVGAFPDGASPYGVLDMSGNVKQWVRSTELDGRDGWIARGSSWYSLRTQLSACNRHFWHHGVRLDDKGFRCAAD